MLADHRTVLRISCSTPFGIRGKGTCCTRFRVTLPEAAQRLSASEEKAPRWNAATSARRSICSTPFGIRGKGTRGEAPPRPPLERSAQRLSASEEKAQDRRGPGCHEDRPAQRLSASEEKAPVGDLQVNLVAVLLNAFRHQRKRHPETEALRGSRDRLLNAFRHQRKRHRVMRLRRGGTERPAQRLSASEEKARIWAKDGGALRVACSTPFGIRGKGTDSGALLPVRRVRCSTPFGIRGKGTQSAATTGHCLRICSTPFGIRGKGTLGLPGQ